MCCLEKQQNSAGKQDAGELNIVPDLLTTVSMAERMTLMVDRPSCVSSWFDRGEKGARAGMVPFAQTKYVWGEWGVRVQPICSTYYFYVVESSLRRTYW